MNLHEHKRRYLIKILSYARGGMEITKEEASKGLGFLSPRKASEKSKAFKRARSARKAAKSEKHATSTKEIRAAVMARAAGRCEACHGYIVLWRLVMDHWRGGSGQRRQCQSVETCWALCQGPLGEGCNRDRTDNNPSAAHWNDVFKTHCEKHGYEFQPHVEHAKVPAPQAPESLPERIAK